MVKDRNELKWLRRSGDEWRWVQQYISTHADARMRGNTERFARRMVEGYDQVVVDIADFEQTTEGLKFVTRLKNALRQHRYRSASNGKKPCTFSLQNSTRSGLSHLASNNQMTETEAITKLIDDAEWAAKKHKEQERKLRIALDLKRKSAELNINSLIAQLEEVMKHLEHSTELLVMWEQSMESEQPPFNGDKETLKCEVEKRMKNVKTINTIVAARYSILSGT
ncbi:hypothetical protein NAG83_06375 [Pseudomonas carnis]|uniref:hypothetical protein n=1 Tax=Pseudomonas carnis TaxID=2487355 RepID=UPI0020947B0C|nr:hypothetical protein [Pseudomonas carnis]MCO7036125.1 hypothetical protein [Pseudomonas carnis]